MNILKLFEKVLQSEDVQGVPILYICIVFNCVIEAIQTGECFYINE